MQKHKFLSNIGGRTGGSLLNKRMGKARLAQDGRVWEEKKEQYVKN